MSEQQDAKNWRASVDSKLQALAEQVLALAEQVLAIDARGKANTESITRMMAGFETSLQINASNAEAIQANTRITLDIKESFDRFKVRAEPVVSVHENVVKGAKMLGDFADWIQTWGKRLVHVAAFGIAFWLFMSVLFSGAGWAEAIRSFVQALQAK